jgi:signal transduction histidine kinase
MGLSSSPGQAPLRKPAHSIGFLFGTELIAPVICLFVLWGLVAAAALSGALDRLRWLASAAHGHRVLAESAVVTGAGLIVVLVTVILMGRFVGRVRRDTENLVAIARSLADEGLPRVVEALRDGADGKALGGAAANTQLPQGSVSEIRAAAEAVASMYRAAVAATAAEAGLRSGFRQILVSLGKRNQSLLHRQLRIIDTLEQQAESPTALAELFTLDHLTTRMRRHAESLTILSGVAPARVWSQPVQVVDVMRAAAAEVEDYTRVTVISDAVEEEAVAASAVTDLIHLLAELIENATLFSPSSTRVEVRAGRVANGFAIEVEDRGLGIPPDQLAELNAQLADPPDFDRADADRLGLFVAGRLAARHSVHVSLCQSPYWGIKAVVLLPDNIVASSAGNRGTDRQRPLRESAQLNLQAPEVLSMAGLVAGVPAFGVPAFGGADSGGADSGGADSGSMAERAETPAPAEAQPRNLSTLRGLPRRVRPDSNSGADTGSATRQESPAPRRAPVAAPGPEDARSLAASLQNSWQRSRPPNNAPDDEEGLWL